LRRLAVPCTVYGCDDAVSWASSVQAYPKGSIVSLKSRFLMRRRGRTADGSVHEASDPLLTAVRSELDRLEREGVPAAAPLIAGFHSMLAEQPDPIAADRQRLIERERRRLRRSEAVLSGGRGTTSTVADVTKRASSPRTQATLLYHLTRSFRASRVLEMGTGVGISGAYLAAALADNGGGQLCSLEGHRDRAETAGAIWKRLGLENAAVVVGRFEHTLEQALSGEPFDIAFIDGNHNGDATRSYVSRIQASSRAGALLILDDIAWSEDMTTAWGAVKAELSDSLTADLGRLGVIILGQHDAGIP
jgi:predicted O-methyltransferase YrrM